MNVLKTIGIAIIGVAVVAIGVNLGTSTPDIDLGRAYAVNVVDMIGTSDDATDLPTSWVFANTTSTNSDADADGGLVTQVIVTEGIDVVRLEIAAVGSVSTSTVSVRLMGSFDGTNYFDMMNATTSANTNGYANGTTSPVILSQVASFAPGTATTSWSYDFNVEGLKSARFLLAGFTDGDLNIGAKAWIRAILVDRN